MMQEYNQIISQMVVSIDNNVVNIKKVKVKVYNKQ